MYTVTLWARAKETPSREVRTKEHFQDRIRAQRILLGNVKTQVFQMVYYRPKGHYFSFQVRPTHILIFTVTLQVRK